MTGSRHWSGEPLYNTTVTYTCGPYGHFVTPDDQEQDEVAVLCTWQKSWQPTSLLPCVANSCPLLPSPPPGSGLQLAEDPEASPSLTSPHHLYSPTSPVTLDLRGADICTGTASLLLVGMVPQERGAPLEVVLNAGRRKVLHITLDTLDLGQAVTVRSGERYIIQIYFKDVLNGQVGSKPQAGVCLPIPGKH